MRIPLKPPTSPLQTAILNQLKSGIQTKQSLSKLLNRPAYIFARSIRSLVAQGKIKQEFLDGETYYSLPNQDEC